MLDLSTSLDVAYAGLTDWLRADFVQGAGVLGLWFTGATCDLTQAQLAALTEAHLDRIHRFARLQRRLGWSTADLDRAITVLGGGVLDQALLVKLSIVKRLQATLSIPLAELCTWWGPLDTRRWEGRLVSGRPASISSSAVGTGWVFVAMPTIADGGLSFYDTLFQNPSATATPDGAFALNAQGTALANETFALSDHAAAVAAGLGISAADLATLTPLLPDGLLKLSNLSLLYRHVSLARAVGLSLPDLVQLLALTGATPFDSTAPANALAFVGEARAARAAPLSLGQIDYVLRDVDTTPPALIPTDTAIGVVLLGLGNALAAATTSDDQRAAVLGRLGPALGLDASLLAPLLDTYVQVPGASPVKLALAAFVDPAIATYAATHPTTPPASTDLPDAFATYRRLAKVALLLGQLRITVDELSWVLGAAAANLPLDVNTLPVTAGAPAALYAGWQRLRTAAQLRDQLPARKLFDLFTAAAASGGSAAAYTALVDALAQRSSWARADLVTLIGAPAGAGGTPPAVASALGLAYPADWLDERGFARVVDALTVTGRVGLAAVVIAPWASIPASPDDRATQADTIRQAVRARNPDPAQWRALASPLRDALRERQRGALVAWLCAHDGRFAIPDDLYGYFLIDVLISPCQLTSRIRQAMSSAQQFVQRALLGLEPTVALAPGDADEWTTWRKSYTLWAANREVFLWPEDWIDPSLRDDKSPLFEALEQALAQGEITAENAEDAVTAYLHGLDELARLEIVATLTDDDADVLHVFGRTRNTPADYYHRQRSAGAWTPWAAMDVQIDDDHLVPVIFQGRLYVFWPQFSTASVQEVPATPSSPGDKTGSLPNSYYQIKLAWSQYRDGAWLPRTLSNVQVGDPVAPSTSSQLSVGNVGPTSNIFFHTEEIDSDLLVAPAVYYRHYGVGDSPAAFRVDGFRLSGCDGTMAIAPVDPLNGFYISAPPNTFPYNQTYTTDVTLRPTPDTEPVSLVWRDPNSSSYHAEPVLGASDGPIAIVPESLQDFGLGGKTPFFFQDRHRTFLVTPNQQRWVPQPPSWLAGDTISLEPVALFAALDRPAVPRPNAWQTDPRTSQQVTTTVRATTPPALKGLSPPPPNTTTSGPIQGLSLIGLPGAGSQQLASALGARVAYIGNAPVQTPSPKISVTSQVTVVSSAGTELITSRSSGANADGTLATFTIDQRFTMPPIDVTDVFQGTVLAPIDPGDFLFTPFYHPYVCTMLRQVALLGMDGLYRPTATSPLPPRQALSTVFFPTTYQPVAVDQPYPVDLFDFSYGGAYARYNWEVFFHIPFAIACRLSANQQFADAQRWFHYIFDPTDVSPDAPAPQRCWKLRPFFELFNGADAAAGPLADLLLLLDYTGTDPAKLAARDDLVAQISAWEAEPFAPDAIARLRLVAYAKAVVRKYVDNLIAWGDQLFAQDTLESVEEATQIYVLASQILGPRPVTIASEPPAAQTFNDLRAEVDAFGEAIEEYLPDVGDPPDDDSSAPPALGSPYFCVPPNTQLVTETWDVVADRLFKIRHCLDLLGQPQQLPLYESPINPALLIQAQAAGVDLASALRDVTAPAPIHRYVVLAQKAGELCAEVRGLGQAMLAALEKQDGEAMALLRADQSVTLLQAIRQTRLQQVNDANATLAAVQASRAAADTRVTYYSTREFMNVGEGMQFTLSSAAAAFDFSAVVASGTGAIVGAFPDLTAGGAGFGGSPFATATGGGSQGHRANDSLASNLQTLAHLSDRAAGLAGIMGSFNRRQDEWNFQRDVAIQDRNALDRQILAAQIRVAIAENELANLDLQTAQANAVSDQLRSKYTNQQLYTWMVGQLSALYQQGYQLAYAVAKEAEKAWQFELAQPTTFIQFGYWDSLKRGLLAGERLHSDLRRMEVAYLDQNIRQYELTSSISLKLLDPAALEALKTTGQCYMNIPEAWYDLDTPGHYLRRVKTVAISLPCDIGPYVPVRCTLTLQSSTIRTSPVPTDPVVPSNLAVQSIVTSRSQEDAGLFETSLRDERYLPFEGAGAISNWHLALPNQYRQFDYATIEDAIVHIRYTARDGGPDLYAAAQSSLQPLLNDLGLAMSLRDDVPDAFESFFAPDPLTSGQQMTFAIDKYRFPHFVRGNTLTITGVDVYMPVRDLTGYQAGTAVQLSLTPPGGTAQAITLSSDSTIAGTPHGSISTASPLGTWTLAFVEANNSGASTTVVGTVDGHQRLLESAVRDMFLIVHYKAVT